MTQLLNRIVAVCIGLGFALTANSQIYPHKIIKIVLPFAAGSGSDVVTRILAANLTESLKQSVIVENRPGANGVIAAEYAARSAPDGYTLFIGLSSTHSANPSLMKALPYDPIKDFAPVAQLGTFFPAILAIDPRLP
ncbi:MAG: tripartite tricarboxylate transporter substrate-binding protein, partial [Sulfuricaulis sp.]|nr:tripartite tricarboxylate transporter substrate-binding protein [Sulfuricaulis sp.]